MAGFAWSKPSVDDDSVDLCLHQRGGGGTVRSPRLDLQIKCRAGKTPTRASFSYPLTLKNYDDLRDVHVQVPRIVVVVVVPAKLTQWIEHSEPKMAILRCGYWASLRGLPASGGGVPRSVTVPRRQMFDVASLTAILARIGNGGLP